MIGLIIVGLILAAIYIANVSDASHKHSAMLHWILYGIAGLNLMLGSSALVSSLSGSLPTLNSGDGLGAFALAVITSGIAVFAIGVPDLRRMLQRTIGTGGGFDPDSNVHLAAFVLAITGVSVNLILFILGGGISGLASDIADAGIALDGVIFQNLIWVVLAAFGVGLWIRRDFSTTIDRLGLNTFTPRNIIAGLIGVVAGIGFIILAGMAMQMLLQPDVLQQQQAASDALVQQFDSVSMALFVAVAVGVGEEILFRGAIQPVFGNLMTSLLFTIIHTQYALTPATLIIFAVSLGFGYLRKHYGTASAIIAHIGYDFFQLATAVLIGNVVMGGGS
ncbi:MAG: CPBP family intramembrane metalloprotease [Anaerolineae bacterium]|nr:CPBP family intramembrane metalloprotease [Anaerolineae bacterium]